MEWLATRPNLVAGRRSRVFRSLTATSMECNLTNILWWNRTEKFRLLLKIIVGMLSHRSVPSPPRNLVASLASWNWICKISETTSKCRRHCHLRRNLNAHRVIKLCEINSSIINRIIRIITTTSHQTKIWNCRYSRRARTSRARIRSWGKYVILSILRIGRFMMRMNRPPYFLIGPQPTISSKQAGLISRKVHRT